MNESSAPEELDNVEQEELAALVPASRSWIMLVGILIVVIALVAAWIGPRLLKPQLGLGWDGPPSAGSSGLIPGAPFVMTETEIEQGDRPVTLLGINDITGARVVISGVVHTEQEKDAMSNAWAEVSKEGCSSEPGCFPGPGPENQVPANAQEVVERLIAAGAPLHETELPQAYSSGDRVWVLWEITSCAPYGYDPDSGTGSPELDPARGVKLQGIFGTTVSQYGYGVWAPFDYGVEWLEEFGSCPV